MAQSNWHVFALIVLIYVESLMIQQLSEKIMNAYVQMIIGKRTIRKIAKLDTYDIFLVTTNVCEISNVLDGNFLVTMVKSVFIWRINAMG